MVSAFRVTICVKINNVDDVYYEIRNHVGIKGAAR